MISFFHMEGFFRALYWQGDLSLSPLFVTFMTIPPPSPPILVMRRTAPVGSYKINTDGCVNDGFMSGRDIIRIVQIISYDIFIIIWPITNFGGQAQSYTGRDSTGQRTWYFNYLDCGRFNCGHSMHRQGEEFIHL